MSAQKDTLNRRTIEFTGTRNFRDLGGIPTPSGETRYGVIYRSDRLSNLTNADGEQLNKLGIATIIADTGNIKTGYHMLFQMCEIFAKVNNRSDCFRDKDNPICIAKLIQ